MEKPCGLSHALRLALDGLLQIDIPAKGRITHHIRTGRIGHALSLCRAGRAWIQRQVWEEARFSLVEQLSLLGRIETLLRDEMSEIMANGEMI